MIIRLTLLLTKIIRRILVKMGRGGSLPGRIALKLCPSLLMQVQYPRIVVMVSGTNGKTTTSNMVYEVLSKQYDRVIANRKGDNLKEGIATLVIANTSFHLKVKADAMVIEVDELNVPKVIKEVAVTHFIVNNFFRDQLDRAGEMETIVVKIENALQYFQGSLILNGDDPNVARLGYQRDDTYYFRVDGNEISQTKTNEASEGKFCFQCNTPLIYDYYQYSHIGQFHCPSCTFGTFATYLKAHDIVVKDCQFTVEDTVFKAPQDALFSIYNCMGVISLAKLLNIKFSIVNNVLSTFELNDGRMETFYIGRDCLLNLVKNPTGANETMKYIQKEEADKDILIILNDNDQDGKDVSWIWDANFELIMNQNVKHIICSGLRAYDMALRLKYTGYRGEIIVREDLSDGVRCLKEFKDAAYVIATYTALQPIRSVLRRESL